MKKFDRFEIKNMSVSDLYKTLTSDSYNLFFCCIEKNGAIYRYKLDCVKNWDDFQRVFESGVLRHFERGVNSDNFSVLDAEYIDCYVKKYPI